MDSVMANGSTNSNRQIRRQQGFGTLAQNANNKEENMKKVIENRNSREETVEVKVFDKHGVLSHIRMVPANEAYGGMTSRPNSIEEDYLSGKMQIPASSQKQKVVYRMMDLNEKHIQFHHELFVPFKNCVNNDLYAKDENHEYLLQTKTSEFYGNFCRMLVAYVRWHDETGLNDANFTNFRTVVISLVTRLLKSTAREDTRGFKYHMLDEEELDFGFIYGIARHHNEDGLAAHPGNKAQTWKELYFKSLEKLGLSGPDGEFVGLDVLRKMDEKTLSERQELYLEMVDLSDDLRAKQRVANGESETPVLTEEQENAGNR